MTIFTLHTILEDIKDIAQRSHEHNCAAWALSHPQKIIQAGHDNRAAFCVVLKSFIAYNCCMALITDQERIEEALETALGTRRRQSQGH